jgi:hypothetical protein
MEAVVRRRKPKPRVRVRGEIDSNSSLFEKIECRSPLPRAIC